MKDLTAGAPMAPLRCLTSATIRGDSSPGKPEHFVQLDAALVTDVGPCIISHNGSSLGVDLPCRHLLREVYSTQKRMQIRVRTYL